MEVIKRLNIVQIFEEYPLFYQPYIPPVVEVLATQPEVELKVNTFKGINSELVDVFPNYHKRRVIERWHEIFGNSSIKLQYNEIQALKKNIDIVHIQHSFLFPKVLGLLQLPVANRPKIVITLRGGDTYVKPWISEKWQTFYRDFGNKVDAFVVMSQHQKSYLHKKWKVDLNRIHVIPISFGFKSVFKAKYPDPDIIKISSVFRMCWEKNIDGNLRVIKLLKKQGYKLQYDIYGDGPDMGQVYYLIDKYKLEDCVIPHGRITNSELKEFLPKSDFFLQLSHSEALPTSVLEAQANGLPAIVSNAGGLPEAIINQESGFSVDIHDINKAVFYITNLWENKIQYHNFSESALQNSNNNFSIEKELKRILSLYNYLINKSR